MTGRAFASTIAGLVLFGAACGTCGFLIGRTQQPEAWQRLPHGGCCPRVRYTTRPLVQ